MERELTREEWEREGVEAKGEMPTADFRNSTQVKLHVKCPLCGAIRVDLIDQGIMKKLARLRTAFSGEGYYKRACDDCYRPVMLRRRA